MLVHAAWAPTGGAIAGQVVLDAFAGTGALGIEALSRGAAHAVFLDRSRPALDAVRANLGDHADRGTVRLADSCSPPRATRAAGLVFLDPPYGAGLVGRALPALRAAGWIAAGALIVVETGRDEPPSLTADPLAERTFGQARIAIFRDGTDRTD